MPEENNDIILSDAAKKILREGTLLSLTEMMGFQFGHTYQFTQRIFQEIALIIAGQLINRIYGTNVLRGYSHAGIYAAHGIGKDYAWTLAENSRIFPFDLLRAKKVDNLTPATLYGTITPGGFIVPPVTITNDIIFVGEYSTLMRGTEQANLAADLRVFQEDGKYTRRLAMLMGLKAEMENPYRRATIEREIKRWKDQGLTINLDNSELTVDSTTSWIINSARFGYQTTFGRPLLSMGDIDRFRWRSYLPDATERRKLFLDVGSFPPASIDTAIVKALSEAWRYLVKFYKNNNIIISIPDDKVSHQKRQEILIATDKELEERYGQLEDKYNEQFINLRASSEFIRIMYQHAALKQFQRCNGYDFSIPDKFIIDYKEDGDFARRIWIDEYIQGLIDVVDDILKADRQYSAKGPKLGEIATRKIFELLEQKPRDFEEIYDILQESVTISKQYLYRILEVLAGDRKIIKINGFYELVKASDDVKGDKQ